MKKIVLSAALLGWSLFSFSQHQIECGSDKVNNKLMAENPTKFLEMEKNLQQIIKSKKHKKGANDLHTIPIVIHVIHTGEAEGVGNNISDAQINSGIQQLNDAFRNTGGLGEDVKIEFELASQDPNCGSTTGINRVDGSGVSGYSADGVDLGTTGALETDIKALSRWPNSAYYNIWLVSEFDGNNGGGGVQGFAYFPGASSEVDGAMIMNTAWGDTGTVNSWNNQGKTGIHEIGHALNLYHTFEGDNSGNSCPATSNGCGSGAGDCCDDTEIHIRNASVCPSGTNACTGVAWAGAQNNFMDYSSQDCQFTFTSDQITRMRAALEESRGGLLTSKAFNTPGTFTAPSAASCEPVTDASWGMAGPYCALTNVTFGNLNINSDYPSVDGPSTNGYLDKSGECILGVQVTEGTSQTLKFTVDGPNPSNVAAWIDYNGNNTLEAGELLGSKTGLSPNATDSITFTVPTDASEITWLRLRIMVDLISISGACHNPQYGQAEDYSVLINPLSSVPVAAFTSNVSSFCAGDSISFTDQSTNTPTNWSWSITGAASSSSTVQNPTFTFTEDGFYNVELITWNSGGYDTLSETNYFMVDSLPILDLGPDTMRCPGSGIVTFDAGAGYVAYSWMDGFSTNQTFGALVASDIWCDVTDDDGCTDRDTINLSEYSINVTKDSGFDDTLGINEGTVAVTFGQPTGGVYSGTGISGSNFVTGTAGAGNHVIKYVYTDGNGCKDSVNCTITVQNPTSLEESGFSNLSVAPNPNTGQFTVAFTNESNDLINFKIIDIQGKVVEQGAINGSRKVQHNFDISALQNGVYQLTMINARGVASLTVVKK